MKQAMTCSKSSSPTTYELSSIEGQEKQLRHRNLNHANHSSDHSHATEERHSTSPQSANSTEVLIHLTKEDSPQPLNIIFPNEVHQEWGRQ